MNPDTTDLILIFAFVLCVIVIAFVSAIPTIYRAGKLHGVLWERERRRGVEARVSQDYPLPPIEETFRNAEWEKELDV